MTDTVRTTAYLTGTAYADGQPPGSIGPQQDRDLIVSLAQRQIVVSLSDQTSDLNTGTSIVVFRIPEPITLSDVRLNCSTAPTGANIIVDVKANGGSIFTVKPSIPAGALTSVGGTPIVLFITQLVDDMQISVDINQVGSVVAGKGLKLTLLGRRS